MAFWNPAEIVGEHPYPLAASLYSEIVLKRSWNVGITQLGYTDIKEKLYVSILGRIYINVNNAFLSLLPQCLPITLKKRLVKTYVKRLENDPSLHDKVEFEIIPNCFNFSFDTEFSKNDYSEYSSEELQRVKQSIQDQTIAILRKWREYIKTAQQICEREIPELQKNYSDLSSQEKIRIALDLFTNCSNTDIPHFAAAARMTFISRSILLSLKREHLLTKQEYLSIVSSITTFAPVSQKIKSILGDRGHLRTGTYDITQLPYAKNRVIGDNPVRVKALKSSIISKKLMVKIEEIVQKYQLTVTATEFLDFLITVSSKREYFKFLFTRQISFGLELLADAGKEWGIERNDLAFLTINDLRKITSLPADEIYAYVEKRVAVLKRKRLFHKLFSFPDCLFSKKDYEIVPIFASKPNFITNKKIASPIVVLTNKNKVIANTLLKGKIVLVESTDPGFDWIFEQQIVGLVTKYGGVGSHMAIRCNEYGIPAALGCGSVLYDQLINAKSILLDCERKTVFPMLH
ncbi:hypothetical protein IT418_03315 [bacterium]|nr:hypothetical protein [bacterium]